MKYSALPWLVALIVIAAATWIVREQRNSNQEILATLTGVRASLERESERSRALEQQVSTLNERVAGLERELSTLRDQVRALSRRSTAIATTTIAPLAPSPLAPLAPLASAVDAVSLEESVVVEILPITWATDWRSFQPAGIIAPPARVVIERRLSDPAFLKKLYVGYAALQIGDVITTTRAINRGAREGNPMISNFAHSPAALIGLKAAASVGMVIAIEKLRQEHPVAASVTMIAINATLAAVTINNATVGAAKSRAVP